ncbi:SCO2322 family protein [Streptomyces qinglanensis]|uniref:SCO2322 family protein n=1 Tax=Streptomyces qinglanensis TaxID=943816 RepID=UPI003D707251
MKTRIPAGSCGLGTAGRAAARSRAPRWGATAAASLAGLAALAVLTVLAVLAVLAVVPAPEAHAATARQPAAESSGYRYWSFWQRQEDGAWSYATEGPATQRPEDGDVLGFRFALSEDSGQADKPRGAVGFAAACEETKAGKDSKRVAVRIDFGTRADAPGSESGDPPAARTGCARIPENGTAADALAKVASPLRYNADALLCAIDGYPAKGCGEQAEGSGGSGKSPDSDGDGDGDGEGSAEGGGQGDGASTAAGVAAGAAAVAILGGAALWQARRRKR